MQKADEVTDLDGFRRGLKRPFPLMSQVLVDGGKPI